MSSAVSAAARSDVALAGKVVKIVACKVEVGSQLQKVTEGAEETCTMVLLCVWEKGKMVEIGSSRDDTHMTWQFLTQFMPGGNLHQSEANHKCLTNFLAQHDRSEFFQRFGWPWKRAGRTNPKDVFVVGNTTFKNFVMRHPSIDQKTVLPPRRTRN